MSKPRFKVGDIVCVRGSRRKAIIERFQNSNCAKLDRPIAGFYLWNVRDLRPWNRRARRRKAKKRNEWNCPTCHQDLSDAPRGGNSGKDCPQCGQGLSRSRLRLMNRHARRKG